MKTIDVGPQSNLTLKRLKDGNHGVFHGEDQVGQIAHKHLMDHLRSFQQSLSQASMTMSSAGVMPVDSLIAAGVRRIMSERGLAYGPALKAVLREDATLAARYRGAHSK